MALSGLDSALSGLRIAQQQLDVIANNVANVSTPGYSRKILPQETIAVGGATVGVRGSPITRNVDLNLSRDLWTQVSATEFYSTQASYLDRIQQFHGPPDAEISIAAELANLRDSFSNLADSPEDAFRQRSVVDQASFVAKKINDFADLIAEMRNDAQNEIAVSVQKVNDLLNTISETNKEIKFNKALNKTSAAIEDTRDKAIAELSQIMEISFFQRGDGVLVVQTSQGVQLADERAETLFFESSALGPTSFYPDSAGGIYVGGDPDINPNAIEITESGIGGRLGALVDLRDNVLPRQQAQLDELAHKLALRFDDQGLRLFTDGSGNVPADTDPVPNPPGPLTPVEYVGFSSNIQVNPAVLNNNRLVQQGTAVTDVPVQNGSNEVVRRIVEFTFGDVAYQEAQGPAAPPRDIRAAATGGVTLQEWLGLTSENMITGTTDMTSYSDINAMISATGDTITPPLNDEFTLTFEEARTGLGPTTVTISLSAAQANFPLGPGINHAADQIVAEINAQIGASGIDPALAASASINQYGQLVFESTGNITIDTGFPTGLTEGGLDLLGLTEGTYQTTDPYFDVRVGNNDSVRVTIEPGDTEVELLDKLEYDGVGNPGIPGLFADIDPADGRLRLRPGGDDTNNGPLFGGDIEIIGGPFTSNGAGGSGAVNGDTLLSALFGTDSPVQNVAHNSFRSSGLGQGVNITTGIISSTSLVDFGQKMVNRQTEEMNLVEARKSDSQTFRDLLQNRQLDESGVNIDEELSNLIVMQTAFSAAARVVTAIDEQFRELLNAV